MCLIQKYFECATIFSVNQICVPAMKCAQYLAKICFIFRQVGGRCIRISGWSPEQMRGQDVHLQEPSHRPPLNATYLPAHCCCTNLAVFSIMRM